MYNIWWIEAEGTLDESVKYKRNFKSFIEALAVFECLQKNPFVSYVMGSWIAELDPAVQAEVNALFSTDIPF